MEDTEKKSSYIGYNDTYKWIEGHQAGNGKIFRQLPAALLLAGFIALSLYDYRLYHSVIELTGAVVAFTMATIAFNTYHINENNWLIFLGIAQGFAAIFFILHIITFMESNYYYVYHYNLSSQFWLIGSGMEYISLLICMRYLRRKINFNKVFISFLGISTALLLLVYRGNMIPESYINGIGFTAFQYMLEYLLLGISIFALLLFIMNQKEMSENISKYMIRYFLATHTAQITFLFSGEMGDITHLAGHIFKVTAVYCMYKALVESSLRKPYGLLHQTNQRLFSEVMIREKTEMELRKEKKELKGILDAVGDGIIVTHKDGTHIHSNNLFYKMFNLPYMFDTESCIGLVNISKRQLMDSDEFEKITKQIWNMPNEFTDYLETKDNRLIERVSRPLILDGVFYGKVWSHRDITEKVIAEQALRESERYHRRLIELLPDAVILHKGEEPIAANSAAFKLMNCTNVEDIKTHLFFNLHSDCKERAAERLAKLTAMETTVDFIEEKLILHDGTVIDVEIGGTSFRQEDGMYIISVVRDISERKKTERLQKTVIEKDRLLDEATEYDRLKTEFFSTISHELKTPLNVILGSVQLLKMRTSVNSDCAYGSSLDKYTRIMMQNCYRLLKLINNLIDITRLDSGFMRLNPVNSDIVRIVEDITLSIADFVETKGITLIFDTDIEEKIIACDGDKLERVMMNLLSNAIKFTPSGGQIEVVVHDSDDWVVITVKDTGIGIPQDKQDIIFERFRQVDGSLRREREGSGIGLSLVKSLVELHGGTVAVKSTVGKGSEFIIQLPTVLITREDNGEAEAAVAQEINVERIDIEFSDIYTL